MRVRMVECASRIQENVRGLRSRAVPTANSALHFTAPRRFCFASLQLTFTSRVRLLQLWIPSLSFSECTAQCGCSAVARRPRPGHPVRSRPVPSAPHWPLRAAPDSIPLGSSTRIHSSDCCVVAIVLTSSRITNAIAIAFGSY